MLWKRRAVTFLSLWLVIVSLTGCEPVPPAGQTAATANLPDPTNSSDPTNSPVNVGSPLRIVSLSPACTEFAYELGVGGALVGRTDCCDFPPEAAAVPIVGTYATPNQEKLAAARPTLIITNDFQDDRLEVFYRKQGITVYRNDPQTLAKFCHQAIDLGRLTNREEPGRLVTQRLEQKIARIDKPEPLVRRSAEGNPVRVLVLVWHKPLCTIGGQTLFADVIRHLGAVNVSDGLSQSYVNISPEQVIHWQPEVIIFPQMGSGTSTAEALFTYPGWEQVPAIRDRRVISDISSDALLRPGPRFTDGIEQLANRLTTVFDRTKP